MEKIQFRAIYGIAVTKSECSAYILQQRLLKKVKGQLETIKEQYGVKWKEVWGKLEDRILVMEKEELLESMKTLDEKGLIEMKSKVEAMINRNRVSFY